MLCQNAVKLPSKDQMCENISAKSRKAVKLEGQSSNHSRPYPWIVFMDEIAEEIGCKPDICKYILLVVNLTYVNKFSDKCKYILWL